MFISKLCRYIGISPTHWVFTDIKSKSTKKKIGDVSVRNSHISISQTGCDQYSGPVPVDFSHSSTGSGPVKSKLLIPVPVPVKLLIPVVSRFQSIQVVLYKALDILCDLLRGYFNPGRCGKIRATDNSSRFHAYFLLFVTSVD